jgi:diacylglycerol kinase (ATP)
VEARHVQIATNPDAGNYKPKLIEALRAAFAAEGATTSLTYVGPGRQLILDEETEILCVAGGDGTFRHAAKTILDCGRAVALAPYPMGTINLFHRERGYPKGPADFAKTVLSGARMDQHFPVVINDSLFLGCASIGPDALAVSRVSPPLKRVIGRAAYGVALAQQLVRWPRPRLTLIADGKRHACEAIYIAKGTYFAGPWTFAPNAVRTHPKLHVVALKSASRRRFIRFIRNVMKGRPLEDRDNLIVLTCTSLAVESDAPWPVQADGDDLGVLPITIATRSETVRVC